ncbi:sigma factor-like helix-turn-helix DNA-binding protein [Listeria cornellensis]|uniref:ECF subfamily RNA polymerase sigma-24 subunit n=1 Tax=Listeria cornellensis FSL F6-0969 TaxID=1265820 RepID=W7BY14_9LIST|nr:sigma factor-like helix-turn-helix DNA-binding protein [Listeria cornellensis]EUJ29615.1 ECF subfamily RNA polymerase sigma-24 subunit [Listeria cornellensis FSL F6-0969]
MIHKLKKEYQSGRLDLLRILDSMPKEESQGVPGKRIVNSKKKDKATLIREMISDMTFAIDWMRTGREPNSIRGIERQGVYNNTVHMDPMILANMIGASMTQKEVDEYPLNEYEAEILEFFHSILSDREKECFMLVRANEYSFHEAAEALHIEKGTVQEYIRRAEEKLKEAFSNNLWFYDYVRG